MHRDRILLLVLQLVLGPAVLASYVDSFTRHPDLVDAMWGGVPEALRGLYTSWMFVAAAGYLVLGYAFLFRTDPDEARILGRGYRLLLVLYTLVLLPSATWMPLTGLLLAGPTPWLWWPVVLGLWLTAAGSLGLIAAAFTTRPHWSGPWRPIAIAASLGFGFQTIVLDGIVWVALFDGAG